MFAPDDPLYALHAEAALASGWPRLRVLCGSADALATVRQRLEQHLGPLSQADEIEPFDADDPADPWELRVDLPGLSAADWPALAALVAEHEHELTPGCPAEVVAADDLGVRLTEWLDGGGIAARLPVAVERGAQRLDLRRRPDVVDDDVRALERELSEALQRHDPHLRLVGDRGADTVTPVVHRTSGRPGLELALDPAAFAAVDGDEVLRRRRAALAALAEVVRARAEHPRLRLAPDPSFELPFGGLSLLAWVVAPHGEPLPGERPLGRGITPHPRALGQLLRDAEGRVHDLEVQVVADTEVALAAVADFPSTTGWRGHTPRWVSVLGDDGATTWRFVPTWRVPLSVDIASLLDRLPGDVRVVPGALVGLEEEDPWLIRTVVWGPERLALRVRDAITDRDLEPATADREAQPDDAPLMGAAIMALGPHAAALRSDGALPVRPVTQGEQRGLCFAWPASELPQAHDILDRLTAAPGVGPWVDWSCPRAGGLRVHIWQHGPASPRQWR